MMVGRFQAIALAGALLFGCAGLTGAVAAPSADQGPARNAQAHPPVTTVAVVAETDDDMTNCSRARRRLWVDGEGWIVRRITTCR